MFSRNYLEMCYKAKEIQQEFLKDIQNKSIIEEDIYVFHPKKKNVEKLILFNEKSVTTDEQQYEIPLSEMIYIPSEKQIRSKAEEFEYMFNEFFYDKKAITGHPSRRFVKPEEKWLALYIAKKYKKEWTGRDWVEIK